MDQVHVTGKERVDFFDAIPHEVQQETDAIEKFLANLRRKEVASQK
ncbi:hypothetical protein KA037_03900 [Patescibacteria group bacterium]|nr:hypothetical protein [Patescibacteria group bacterium]MBP7841784.1 hypothetical protein [Patescibacteria group bacterium]